MQWSGWHSRKGIKVNNKKSWFMFPLEVAFKLNLFRFFRAQAFDANVANFV